MVPKKMENVYEKELCPTNQVYVYILNSHLVLQP